MTNSPGEIAHSKHYLRSGVIGGAASVFVFTLVHYILISDIWEMLIIMMVAGAACGLTVGWSYGRLFPSPGLGSWFGYNSVYLVMFGLLGWISVLMFEPVTTVVAINEAGGPIDELIVQALPMTVVFTLTTAGLMSLLFGRSWSRFGAILLTTFVLVLFLGLNISAIGLVEFTSGSIYLVAEFFGLVALLGVVFALVFAALERRALTGRL